ncbi:type II toxin-antitoxin system VapC family toxin [Phenylobacterium ferrooxidans]|jgi:ribonuclease VapC|uniref:Ribonuclease VapC n=1 Tax=Phenylobacterium ferrooxidans TaxID=2982689 RepID=A0ABW6CNA2_9CAUL
MIVVDTSALLAIVLDEAVSETSIAVLEAETEVLISAATLAEALIVAARRGVATEVDQLVVGLAFTVIPVGESAARLVSQAYAQWGKGLHPAGLNYGDCFAYALAKENDCALLFIGDDFSRTDVKVAA